MYVSEIASNFKKTKAHIGAWWHDSHGRLSPWIFCQDFLRHRAHVTPHVVSFAIDSRAWCTLYHVATTATAQDTVKLVMRMIFALHGCPRLIVSDRGTQFDSQLWRELWEAMGTRVALATTHHPQTNGLTERLNRTLLSMIRKFTQQVAGRWAELLPLFEFAYNRSKHEQTQCTPFSVVYGEDPPVPLDYLIGKDVSAQSTVPTEFARQRQEALQAIQRILQERQERQNKDIKAREDQRRGRPQYFPGDEVLVYWPPFAPRTTLVRKQRLRYEGPFQVEKVISDAVVQLQGLPDRMGPLMNVEFLHLYKRSDEEELKEARGDN